MKQITEQVRTPAPWGPPLSLVKALDSIINILSTPSRRDLKIFTTPAPIYLYNKVTCHHLRSPIQALSLPLLCFSILVLVSPIISLVFSAECSGIFLGSRTYIRVCFAAPAISRCRMVMFESLTRRAPHLEDYPL